MIKSSKNALIEKQNKETEMEMRNIRYNELRDECIRRKKEKEKFLAMKRRNELKKFLQFQV